MGPQTLTPTLISLTVKALFTLPFLWEPRCCNQSLTTPQTALGRRHSQHLIDLRAQAHSQKTSMPSHLFSSWASNTWVPLKGTRSVKGEGKMGT